MARRQHRQPLLAMLSRFFKRESAKADFGSDLPGAPLNSIYGPGGRPAEPSLEPSSTSHNLECVEVNLIAEGKPVRLGLAECYAHVVLY